MVNIGWLPGAAPAGISYNKFLAKIASGYNKPDGQFLIHPQRALAFIDSLPTAQGVHLPPLIERDGVSYGRLLQSHKALRMVGYGLIGLHTAGEVVLARR
ncbi:MAG: hypothetical protein KDI16_15535 [Halioglobus sp.]|nr:hypothetical protein [Halioglobus sp.]